MTPALPNTLTLKAGAHTPGGDDMCVMEAVAYVAGEEWTDSPVCACPVIAAFLRSWNDGITDDATRTRLLTQFIPRLVGSKSTDRVEDTRAWLAVDWSVRVSTPAWLDLAGPTDHADALRSLPEVTAETVTAARPAIDAARAAAGAAARDAAENAAWDAARAAAWDAAWAAAGDAAWVAAWDAARAAAEGAAGDAARDAAGDAAWAALRPTVETLQQSVLDLLDRMLTCGEHRREEER